MEKTDCKAILGNHDLWHLTCQEENNSYSGPTEAYLRSLYLTMEMKVEKRSLLMVHASPPDSILNGIKLLDNNGQLCKKKIDFWQQRLSNLPYDILVVGHTHQVFAYQFGKTLVINPGSTVFNHTCATLSLPAMDVKLFSLSGRRPVLSWNWGQFEGDVSPVYPKAYN
jgi:predicted phosphodiesterase